MAQTAPAPLTASALTVGEMAPDFKAKDAAGHPVELEQLLKRGPVVLYFYRGQWCPYCSKGEHLKVWGNLLLQSV